MRAGVSAFGFGGINVHVTVESADPPHMGIKPDIDERALFVSPQDTEVLLFRAPTADALRVQIEPLSRIAHDLSAAEMTDLSVHLAKLIADGPFRAAIVAANPQELRRKLETLLFMLKTPPADGAVTVDVARDVWVSNNRGKSRIGFVFPGQGSQHLNMAKPLVERFHWARDAVSEADATVGPLHNTTLSDSIFRPVYRATGEETERWKRHLMQTEVCQPAVCLASMLYAKRLNQLGIEPSAVGGHSLGELTAYWAAGAISDRELLQLARLRGASMAAPSTAAGSMASLRCSKQDAEALCHQVSGYVIVANINGDQQTIVSGDTTSVDDVVMRAGQIGIQGQRLPVSNAFHSKYVSTAAQRLMRESSLPERVPFLSAKLFTGQKGAETIEGDSLRDHFSKQVVDQVDFVSLGAALAQEVDLLIEVGPGRVLTGLISDNAAIHSVLCLPVEVQPGKQEPLNRVIAAAFVHGAPLRTEAIFEQRLSFPFVSPEHRRFIENPCERDFAEPNVPESYDRSLKGAFESQLADRTGYDKAILEAYLESRGGFLSEVVRADIAAGQFGAGCSERVIDSDARTASNVGAIEGLPEPNSLSTIDSGAHSPDAGYSIEEIVINLVAERTGFPRESLRPEMTFLNDLNIESIATGEIIVKAAHLAGVAGQLDPAEFLQASIQEVVDAVRSVATGAELSKPTKFNAADKSELLEILEKLTGKSTWVRAFQVDYAEEDLSTQESEAYERALAGKSTVVVSDTEHTLYAAAIADAFTAMGANAHTVAYAELAKESNLAPDIMVAVLPTVEAEVQASGEAIRTFIPRILDPAARAGTGEAELIYVEFGGGYFGSRPELVAGRSIPVCAFAASLHHERRKLRVRVLDFSPATEPAILAGRVVDESIGESSFVRAGYDACGIRRIPRPVVVDRGMAQPRRTTLSKGDVVVVTGGGKGATSEIALAIGKKTGARCVLLGRTRTSDLETPDGEEIAATLRRFEEVGVPCRYVSCDITDALSVATTLHAVQDELGPITGVIHGAGLNRPALVGAETVDDAYETIAPKVAGLANILAVLGDSPPKLVVGLSSIIAFTGMPGNAWYAFANEVLDRLLQRYRHDHPDTAVLSLAYSLWESLGMGVKLEGVADRVRRMGTSAIPVAKATECFVDLVERDHGSEHLIVAGRLAGLDTWCPDAGTIPRGRFFEEILSFQPRVEVVSKIHLSLERDPYLSDHVYKGTYLFPVVFGLETMAQAVAAALGRSNLGRVRIEDVDLARPIFVDPKEGEDILVHAEVLEREGASTEQRIAVGIACQQTNFSVNHFSSTFVVIEDEVEERYYAFDRPTSPLAIDPVPEIYGRFLFHGPFFQRLKHIYVLKSDYCIFSAEQRSSAEQDNFLLGDPYFRDSLFQAGQVVLSQVRGLPRSIGCIEIYPPNGELTEEPIIEGMLIERTDEFAVCTITVVDGRGRILQKLENCRFSIIEHLSDEPTAEEIAAPDGRDEGILLERLHTASAALNVRLPAVALANLPGIHTFSAPERWSREQSVLQRAVDDWHSRQVTVSTHEDAAVHGHR
jgi:malonyl CoA-acyl carrier protein transacylase/NADP-dependent 3-hydroxy acid dehydrogenase YdfG